MRLFDTPITKKTETLEAPNTEVSVGRSSAAPLAHLYRWKEDNFGQSTWNKSVVIFGTSWKLGEPLRTFMGTKIQTPGKIDHEPNLCRLWNVWMGGRVLMPTPQYRRVLTPFGVGIISLAISGREIHGCRWPPYTLWTFFKVLYVVGTFLYECILLREGHLRVWARGCSQTWGEYTSTGTSPCVNNSLFISSLFSRFVKFFFFHRNI